MKRFLLVSLLVATILVGGFVSIGYCSPYNEGAEAVNELISSNIIVKHGYGKYYIDPSVWYSIDINKKKVLAFLCACHYYVYGGNNVLRSEIYDGRSGKKFGSYSEVWGFKATN